MWRLDFVLLYNLVHGGRSYCLLPAATQTGSLPLEEWTCRATYASTSHMNKLQKNTLTATAVFIDFLQMNQKDQVRTKSSPYPPFSCWHLTWTSPQFQLRWHLWALWLNWGTTQQKISHSDQIFNPLMASDPTGITVNSNERVIKTEFSVSGDGDSFIDATESSSVSWPFMNWTQKLSQLVLEWRQSDANEPQLTLWS